MTKLGDQWRILDSILHIAGTRAHPGEVDLSSSIRVAYLIIADEEAQVKFVDVKLVSRW